MQKNEVFCPIYRRQLELNRGDEPMYEVLSNKERSALIDTCDPDLCDCYFFACNGGLGAT